MTVSSPINIAGPYVGNNSTTEFSFAFTIFSDADLEVTHTDLSGVDTALVLGVDYSVSVANYPGYGFIQYPVSGSPLPSGQRVTIRRLLPLTQTTDLRNQGGYYPQNLEDALDRGAMIAQQLSEEQTRTLKWSVSDVSGVEPTIPSPEAKKIIGFNADGTAMQLYSAADIDRALVSGFMETVLDDMTVGAALTTLGAQPVNSVLSAFADLTPLEGQNLQFDGTAWNVGREVQPTLIDNGAMLVNQRGNQTGMVFTAKNYLTDRFTTYGNLTPVVVTSSQETSGGPTAFPTWLKLNVTTASGAVASGHSATLNQLMEGANLQGLEYGTGGAKSLTCSFWFRSPKTGAHHVSLYQGNATRRFIREFTVVATNTWEYFTVTIPGDATGLINNDNGPSLWIRWSLMADAGAQSSPDNWSNGGQIAVAGTANLLDTIGNVIGLTGVKLEVGEVATDFVHEGHGETLAKCQRYFQSWQHTAAIYFNVHANATSRVYGELKFPKMRTDPTFTQALAAQWNVSARNVSVPVNGVTFSASGPASGFISANLNSPYITLGDGCILSCSPGATDAFIYASAEL